MKATRSDAEKKEQTTKVEFGSLAGIAARKISKNRTRSKIARSKQTDYKTILDSTALNTMIKLVSETAPNTFEPNYDTMVYAAAADEPTSCLEAGKLMLKNLSVPISLYVRNLNDTLVSASQTCDGGRVVLITRNEANRLGARTVSVPVGDILAVVSRDLSLHLMSSLYH